uniref:Uncharacterized protein n=1 Tax=Tetranychus urticae TaxID=32264 RepID=T1K5L3_TETUR
MIRSDHKSGSTKSGELAGRFMEDTKGLNHSLNVYLPMNQRKSISIKNSN